MAGALVQLPALGMRSYADSLGYFRMEGVPSGVHQISAHQLGYVTMETMTEAGTGTVLAIQLFPSPVSLEEISVTVDRLASRRRATPYMVTTLSQQEMIRLNAFDAFEALERTPGLFLRYCSSSASLECIWSRGRTQRLRFVVDDMPAWAGAVELEAYDVADLHSIEVIRGCALVRVYTNRYVERMAKRGQRLDPFICRYP